MQVTAGFTNQHDLSLTQTELLIPPCYCKRETIFLPSTKHKVCALLLIWGIQHKQGTAFYWVTEIRFSQCVYQAALVAVERAPSHKPCYLFIYLPKSIRKFSAFLFVWTSGFLLSVLHNFLIGWLFFIPKKNKDWCSVRGFPLICTKQGEECVSLRDPSCCLLLFHFLSNCDSIVKVWLCAPI